MKVRSLKLHDERFGNQWSEQIENRWDYDQCKADARFAKGWISFDCAAYVPEQERVYLGVTSFTADIFKAYDRKTDRFVDLGYGSIADPFDAKFHRSLERMDGALYAAPALLHCSDKFLEAPGGAIIKYDLKSGAVTKLGIPLPHVYVQGIALDAKRGLLHGMCFAPEHLFTFNLRTGVTTDHGITNGGYGGMGQGENICLDDRGGAWCGWMLTRAWQPHPGPDAHRLCKIDPDQNRIVFYQRGLPRRDRSPGFAKVEGLFNFHDGHMYASGDNGSIYRFNPDTAEADYLFTPIADRPSRLSSMTLGRDGLAYGVTGCAGKCELLRFDFKNSKYELLGGIKDQDGEPLFQVHNIVRADDGTLYACENDVPHRSSYLWEISGIG